MERITPNSIAEYIAGFPEPVRSILARIRIAIGKAAPAAEETISYQMPAFSQNGILVYFAACKHHIGFYPTASGMAAFQNELSQYPSSKGAVRFPLDQPIPYGLIRKIVQYRVKENLEKSSTKAKKRKA